GEPVSPLDDAGVRSEGDSGPTDYGLAIRQRGRSRADQYRRVIGCHDAFGGLWPAPARFPCVSSRSRNHISPSQVPTSKSVGLPSVTPRAGRTFPERSGPARPRFGTEPAHEQPDSSLLR